jgi:hypothetical protein
MLSVLHGERKASSKMVSVFYDFMFRALYFDLRKSSLTQSTTASVDGSQVSSFSARASRSRIPQQGQWIEPVDET